MDIKAVDGALIGVPVGAGSHRVDIQYRPTHFYAGALLSAIATAVIAGLVVRRRRPGRS